MTDDFIPYTPGDPIPTGRVKVRLRGGEEDSEFEVASAWDWSHAGGAGDIVAYQRMPRPATWTPPNPPGETIDGTIEHVIGDLAWFRYTHRPDGAEHNEVVPLYQLRSE